VDDEESSSTSEFEDDIENDFSLEISKEAAPKSDSTRAVLR
jgi:hypothetical protein